MIIQVKTHTQAILMKKIDCLIDSKFDCTLLKMNMKYLESHYNQMLNNQKQIEQLNMPEFLRYLQEWIALKQG